MEQKGAHVSRHIGACPPIVPRAICVILQSTNWRNTWVDHLAVRTNKGRSVSRSTSRFTPALFALRRIADQLLDRAEGGDLAAAREIIDRLDGRAAQTVEYGDLPVSELTDAQLHEIACRSWDENGPPVRMLSPPQR